MIFWIKEMFKETMKTKLKKYWYMRLYMYDNDCSSDFA